ncbi:MAG: hypothetical protein GXY33_08350 [Phycisphaerae bacterium]|nr:hypothetical protein [Phycisphaerae bacterium]
MRKEARSASPAKVAIIIAAVVIGLIGLVYLLGEDSEPQQPTTQPRLAVIPEVWQKQIGDRVTEVRFPMSARSENPDVNRFIAEFIDLVLADPRVEKNYKLYRQAVTQRRRPFDETPFERAQYKAKLIEIESIVKLESPAQMKVDELRDAVEGSVYRVLTHIDLRDGTERDIETYVFEEDGRWVSSH